MRKQYLHLSAYSCDECAGPVIAGSLGVRENEISKETEITHVSNLLDVRPSAEQSYRAGACPLFVAVRMGCDRSSLVAATCKRGGAQSCRTTLSNELWTCNPPL